MYEVIPKIDKAIIGGFEYRKIAGDPFQPSTYLIFLANDPPCADALRTIELERFARRGDGNFLLSTVRYSLVAKGFRQDYSGGRVVAIGSTGHYVSVGVDHNAHKFDPVFMNRAIGEGMPVQEMINEAIQGGERWEL